jgi:hypothetical protein
MTALVAAQLHERRRSLLSWGLPIGLMSAFVAIYPSVEDALGKAIASYPEALKEAFGIAELTTVEQYLNAEMLSLALLFAGFGVLATAWSLRTSVVTGSVAGVLVAMYVADLIGRLDSGLDWIRYGSVFRYYGKAIEDGIDPLAFAGVTVAALALAALGALLFERRDISS